MKLNRLVRRYIFPHRRRPVLSYSQCWEDLIIAFILKGFGIDKPSYLDIGAHNPIVFNNTYYFYRRGGSGVCIESQPELFRRLRQVRKRDICLNIGLGSSKVKLSNFYVVQPDTLSTFSKDVAEEYVSFGYRIEKVIQIPLFPINQIFADHFVDRTPNIISLDTEGNELDVLNGLNFSVYRPEVFCVETLTHVGGNKITSIIDLLEQNGYFVYADTYINTIFVEKRKYENAKKRI
jgi:FkbM family methyltransferase